METNGSHETVLTHGALHPRNIMVSITSTTSGTLSSSRVDVTGILNWEVCGWYPEYWEYVRALHGVGSWEGD